MPDRPVWKIKQPPIEEMHSPVQCVHCAAIYCLGRVHVTDRYMDCTVWTAPCCGHPGVDDRPWVKDRHYREVPRGRAGLSGRGMIVDDRGMIRMWP